MDDKKDLTSNNGTLTYQYSPDKVFTRKCPSTIPALAFSGNHGLISVVIPVGTQSIGDYAFNNCRSLESVTIPASVTSIGQEAFSGCSKLEKLIVPDTVISVGNKAFHGCDLLAKQYEFLIIGGTLLYYYGTDIDIFFPDNITSIDAQFSLKGNKRIIAPKLPYEFLKNAKLLPQAAMGYLFYSEKYTDTQIVQHYNKYIAAQKKKLLPLLFAQDAVQGIQVYAQAGIINAKNIETEFLQQAIDANATQCTAFLLDWKSKNISAEQTEKLLMKELQKDPYNAEDMKKIWSYENKSDGTLVITSYKGKSTDIIIPERIGKKEVSAIGDSAFSCIKIGRSEAQKKILRNITSITIPESIRQIGEQTFYGCENLATVSISASTYIGDRSFYNCHKLADKDGFIIVGNVLFDYIGRKKKIIIPNHVTSISASAFSYCNITSITIPNSVSSVGNGAFYRCNGLADSDGFVIVRNVLYGYCGDSKKVSIPDGVVEISDHAFELRESVSSIIVPDSVTRIGNYAFEKCTGLKKIILPSGVTHIGNNPLYGCKKVTFHAPAGSYAEQYAKEHNIPFVAE